MKRLLGLILLVMQVSMIQAQGLRSFSVDHEEFKKQLFDFYAEYDKKWAKEQTEILFEAFDGRWSPSQKDQFIRGCNVLLKKRLRAFPEFYQYHQLVLQFSKVDPQGFGKWSDALESLGPKWRGVQLRNFLKASYEVYVNYAFYNANSFQWTYTGGSRSFVLEEVDGEPRPMLLMEEFDLRLQDAYDTSIIVGVSARFDMMEELLFATGGLVTWERVGYSKDSISAELTNYQIRVDKPVLEADSVTLRSVYYIDRPLLGGLQEKLSSNKDNNSKYPSFRSYDKNVVIQEVAEEVSFVGGFSVGGRSFYGYGDRQNKAVLTFMRGDVPAMRARAFNFSIKENKIMASRASIVIYLEGDSIFHPELNLRYEAENRALQLKRNDQGIGKAPFNNSMHKVDMHFETLNWNLKEDSLYFTNLSRGTSTPALFESINYFSMERFEALQGMDFRHPLYGLKRMAENYDGRTFHALDVANSMQMNEEQVVFMLMNFAVAGYVNFDLESRIVQLNQRMFDFLAAREEKRDYDVLQFISNTQKDNNAILSLENYDMQLHGVRALQLSDSQQVYVYPYGQELTLKKNRDFVFSGKVVAGRFHFFGMDHVFNYDDFTLNMEQIDSMRFYVPEQDRVFEEGEPVPLIAVKTVLRDMTGVLEIDGPNNKSGLKEMEQYPRFQSGNETFAYYDKALNGAYKKEEFFFQVDPFLIESLDDFETKDLAFKGTMNSAGIFGDFQEVLKVQPDYSLGFTVKTPEEGFAMYDGKGVFNNDLTLSNAGLQGGGELKYLNALAVSDTFYFTPDSTVGIAQSFTVSEQVGAVEYPQTNGQGVKIRWEAPADRMFAMSRETPMTVFREQAKLEGTLEVNPQGARASGIVAFRDAEASSADFQMNHNAYSAESASLRWGQTEGKDWAVSISDAKSEVDFSTNRGLFTLNEKTDFIAFENNQYRCYMDKLDWDMSNAIMNISQGSSTDQSPLVSTHPDQDGLKFTADRARYTHTEKLLEAYEVPFIGIADARLMVPQGYVAVYENAKMKAFQDAQIVADTSLEHHELYAVSIEVQGRLAVQGKAVYDYVDAGGTKQTIEFGELSVNEAGQFVANGAIEQGQRFALSPQFGFYGEVELLGVDPLLHMSGHTIVRQACSGLETSWVPFQSSIDPNQIIIDLKYIDEVLGADSIYTGMALDHGSLEPYALLLAPKRHPKDVLMMSAKGLISYDQGAKAFTVTNHGRLKDDKNPSSIWVLSEETCSIEAEGKVDLGARNGQVAWSNYGVLSFNLNSDALSYKGTLGLEFFFDETTLEFMHGKLMDEPMLQAANLSLPTTRRAYRSILGVKGSKEYFEDIDRFGEVKKIPEDLQRTLMFALVELEWKSDKQVWLSSGDLHLSNLGPYQVNRKIRGNIVLERGAEEDELFVFVKATAQNYYFFNYRRNMMESLSSHNEYMDLLRAIDPKKRKMKVGRNQAAYSFGPLNVVRRLETFLQKY